MTQLLEVCALFIQQVLEEGGRFVIAHAPGMEQRVAVDLHCVGLELAVVRQQVLGSAYLPVVMMPIFGSRPPDVMV